MRAESLIIAGLGGLALTACDARAETVASAPPPVSGSAAADSDGDGIVADFYTSDGKCHRSYAPPLPVTPLGERG